MATDKETARNSTPKEATWCRLTAPGMVYFCQKDAIQRRRSLALADLVGQAVQQHILDAIAPRGGRAVSCQPSTPPGGRGRLPGL